MLRLISALGRALRPILVALLAGFGSTSWFPVTAETTLEPAWTLELSSLAEAGAEHRASCLPVRGERVDLLFRAQNGGGDPRVLLTTVSVEGRVEGTRAVELAGDPLEDAHGCYVLASGELLIVGRVRSGALVAVQGRQGAWSTIATLRRDTGDLRVSSLVALPDGRLVAAGARSLHGFVVIFDLTSSHDVRWVDWDAAAAYSLVLDVLPGRESFAICGLEAGTPEELFAAGTVFVATLDATGATLQQVRMPGRACRILSKRASAASLALLHEDHVEVPGTLTLLQLGQDLEVLGRQVWAGEVFHLFELHAAESPSHLALLNELPVRESIELFDLDTGRRLASARLGVFPSGGLSVVAAGELFLVMSQPLGSVPRRRGPRVDAFMPPQAPSR